MILPAQVPASLRLYEEAESDERLFEKLSRKPEDLLFFFEYASADETWSEHHSAFMGMALNWFTTQFYENKLTLEIAGKIEALFRQHFYIQKLYIPLDLTVVSGKNSVLVNSLLLAMSSGTFRDMIRSQRTSSSLRKLTLDEIPYELLIQVIEYVSTGTVADLWKQEQSEIIKLLRLAVSLELPKLAEHCETVLKRYINRDNVVDKLVQAYKESWHLLKECCFQMINEMGLGVRVYSVEQRRVVFEEKEVSPLAFEFLNFGESALELFSKLSPYITHLNCSGPLTDESAFSMVVRACPQLIALDISRSRKYSDRLMDIPQNLQEIDLSKCLWLTDANLQKMISYSNQIIRLYLSSNVQLTFQGWVELLQYHRLKALDISRCSQINDEILALILKACEHLVEFDIAECKRISEKGFFDIPRHLHSVAILNVSRTNISDAALIDIATHCLELRSLDLTRCQSVSSKGILQTVKLAANLQEINISGCSISDEDIAKLKERFPYLNVLFTL